jgi:hypothetical protein
MDPQYQEILNNAIWITITVACICFLYLCALSAEKAKKSQQQTTTDDFLSSIEGDSIYCGESSIKALYDAAKRARKDKALKRDVRMELDRAINQYENTQRC